jgi:hypothetical protein
MAVIVPTVAMKPAVVHPFFTKPLTSNKSTPTTDAGDSDEVTRPQKDEKEEKELGATQHSDPVSSKKRKSDAVKDAVPSAESDPKEQVNPEPVPPTSNHEQGKPLGPIPNVQVAVKPKEAESSPQHAEVKKGTFCSAILSINSNNQQPNLSLY